MKNIVQGTTWEETIGRIFEEIESCNSVIQLRDIRIIHTHLMEDIKSSQLFFKCEYNNNATKITVSSIDGEYMMIMLVNGKFSTVPDDIQAEISKQLLELSEKVIGRIDERIYIVEEQNERLKKRETVILVIALLMLVAATLCSLFSTEIMVKFVFRVLTIISGIIAAIIPMKWVLRD